MSKGIAIRSVLLLLIGFLVAGIIVYLVYKYASGSIISEGECNARLSEICILCKNSGWIGWPSRTNPVDAPFFQVIDDCSSYSKFSSFACGGTCESCTQLQNPCKGFGIE